MNPLLRAGALSGRISAFATLTFLVSANAVAQCPSWSNALGDFQLTYFSTPRDAIVFDDGSGAGPTTWVAYTGGSTENIAYGGVGRFVGGAWVDTDPNPNASGTTFAIHDAGAGPELYVGGGAGGGGGVRRFTNGVWVPVDPLAAHVQELAVFDFGNGPELHAAGRGANSGAFSVAKLVANTWVPLSADFSTVSQVYAMAAFDAGAGPELYVAGKWLLAGGTEFLRLGASGWTAVPMPGGNLEPMPDCVEVHDDGSGPRLFAVFRVIGGDEAKIGAFDGSSWTLLPSGFPTGYPGVYPRIRELRSHAEIPGGPRSLYVAGGFAWVGGIPAQSVARWDGAAWSAIVPGVTAPIGADVHMLASLPGNATTPARLAVGGRFDQADGLPARNIALWEGCVTEGVIVCAGDGSAAACPCGNFGTTGAGCASSLGFGATLRAAGVASLAADSLVLLGASMPNSSALYFQGTSLFQGGTGVAFGDGLRCASGSIVRLGVAANAGGASSYPSAGAPSVSVRGQVTAPGVRHYQVWYRNAAAFCTSSTFNLTNALSVQWQS